MTEDALFHRVDALRREFDDSFAAEAVSGNVRSDELLALRLRGDPHLMRLVDVNRLLRVGPLLRYPSAATAWLGLTSVAGGVVPVYDLGVLVGYPPAGAPGWIALCAAAPVALAFDSFDGQVRHMYERDPDGVPSGAGAGRVVGVAGVSYPLIDMDALVERLRAAVGAPAQTSAQTPTPPPSAGG